MNTPKPDFSDIRTGSSSAPASTPAHPDFSDVRTGSSVAPDTGARQADAAPRTYTVRKGDTLSAIAQHVYGRASRWHAIFEANRGLLDDPDRIQPGQVLTLPELDDDGRH